MKDISRSFKIPRAGWILTILWAGFILILGLAMFSRYGMNADALGQMLGIMFLPAFFGWCAGRYLPLKTTASRNKAFYIVFVLLILGQINRASTGLTERHSSSSTSPTVQEFYKR